MAKEKIPKIHNPPPGAINPGKVGFEKPRQGIIALRPPPKGRAIEPVQKEEILATLITVWKTYPYLRLGQLLACIAGNNLFNIEDVPFEQAMMSFNPSHSTECGDFSQSRTCRCTLDKGHSEGHFSRDSGLSWRQF